MPKIFDLEEQESLAKFVVAGAYALMKRGVQPMYVVGINPDNATVAVISYADDTTIMESVGQILASGKRTNQVLAVNMATGVVRVIPREEKEEH